MKFPQLGQSRDDILANLQSRKQSDVPSEDGRVFAYIYDAGEEAKQLLKDAFNLYLMENGLDPTSFPSCMELEKEVIGMAVDLVNGGRDATGTFTSGGTESILLSLKTTRDFRRYQIFYYANWTGYAVINPGVTSTKGGGPIAACWAILN